MRALIVVSAILFAAAAFSPRASAQNYPWCAVYGTGDGDATNCGFVSREQCLATISGVGGHCDPNNQYVPPPPAHPAAPPAGKPEHR